MLTCKVFLALAFVVAAVFAAEEEKDLDAAGGHLLGYGGLGYGGYGAGLYGGGYGGYGLYVTISIDLLLCWISLLIVNF